MLSYLNIILHLKPVEALSVGPFEYFTEVLDHKSPRQRESHGRCIDEGSRTRRVECEVERSLGSEPAFFNGHRINIYDFRDWLHTALNMATTAPAHNDTRAQCEALLGSNWVEFTQFVVCAPHTHTHTLRHTQRHTLSPYLGGQAGRHENADGLSSLWHEVVRNASQGERAYLCVCVCVCVWVGAEPALHILFKLGHFVNTLLKKGYLGRASLHKRCVCVSVCVSVCVCVLFLCNIQNNYVWSQCPDTHPKVQQAV